MSSHLLRIVWTIYYKSLTWFKAFVLCPFVWPAPSSSKSGPSVWVSWNVHLAELSKSTMASKETYARFILTLRFMTFMVEEAFLCLFSQSRSKNTSIWVFKGKFGNWVGKDSTPQVSSIICNWSTISDWKGTIGRDIQPEVKILAPCKYKEGTLPRFSSGIGSSRTIATACSTTVRQDWPNSDNVTCHSVADFHVPGKIICFNPSLVGRTTGKIHWWANIQDNASSLQLMPVALFNGPSVLSHGQLNSAHQFNVIIEHSRPQIASPKKSVEKDPKEIGFVGRQFLKASTICCLDQAAPVAETVGGVNFALKSCKSKSSWKAWCNRRLCSKMSVALESSSLAKEGYNRVAAAIARSLAAWFPIAQTLSRSLSMASMDWIFWCALTFTSWQKFLSRISQARERRSRCSQRMNPEGWEADIIVWKLLIATLQSTCMVPLPILSTISKIAIISDRSISCSPCVREQTAGIQKGGNSLRYLYCLANWILWASSIHVSKTIAYPANRAVGNAGCCEEPSVHQWISTPLCNKSR